VQRLFSSFPGGSPGIGLLLLRLVLGWRVFGAVAWLSACGAENQLTWLRAVALVWVVGSILIVIGLMTPIVQAIVGTSFAIITFTNILHIGPLCVDTGSAVLAVVMSTSLALLGPGAYSCDARLFGRRVIMIPPALPRPRR
jgi:uncharacterized membrane protein YphA (DoxX/SURF4 family)